MQCHNAFVLNLGTSMEKLRIFNTLIVEENNFAASCLTLKHIILSVTIESLKLGFNII